MLRHVIWQEFITVSEVLIASIIRAMSKPHVRYWLQIHEPVGQGRTFATWPGAVGK
jgi:hypothetical protein